MIRPRQFDLIAFDWDGTLFDSTSLIVRCIQSACADLGLPVPSDRDASYVIGLGLDEALEQVVPALSRERYAELGHRFRRHFLARKHEIVLFDGVLAMLQALKARNHWLAVATGKSRRGLDEALETAALRGLFDGSRTADETASKPSPQMLLELIREFGVDPSRTLMIGDTTHDLEMARNAGTASVGVSYGAHEPATFDAYQTRHVAHSVADLHAWLMAHG